MSILLLDTDAAEQNGDELNVRQALHDNSAFTFYTTGTLSAGKVVIQASPSGGLDDWITFKEISATGYTTVEAGSERLRATTDAQFQGDVKVYLVH